MLLPTVAYGTDRSIAVVLFMFILCGFVLHTLVLFSIAITSLGEERASLYASRAFVCLSDMHYFLSFIRFLFVSGIGCSLWLWHSL